MQGGRLAGGARRNAHAAVFQVELDALDAQGSPEDDRRDVAGGRDEKEELMLIGGGYYIDDAGTPGAESKSAFLDKSRKSWCAVIVSERAAEPLNRGVQIFLRGVKQDYGVDELHFSDVYSGKGRWKTVPVAERIEIFDLMTIVFERFKLPVIFQTVSQSMYSDHARFFSRMMAKLGEFWDISSIPHFGLLSMCYQISKNFDYLKMEYPSDFPRPLSAYVDEGLAKAGAEVKLPNWEHAIEGGKLTFQSSVDNPGLQLADFAAFSISRSQWIAAKQEKGEPIRDGDRHIMSISGKLNVNLPRVEIDPADFSREDYERFLRWDRVAKGLPEYPRRDSK